MGGNWTEVEPLGPCVAGDIGGDEQVSTAWSRQFALPRRADGGLPLLTVSYYVALENHNDEDDKRVFLRRHVEFLVCDDLSDPGGTERWSEYGYGRAGLPWRATQDDARRACVEADSPTLADWDGTERHGVERARATNAGE